MDLKLKDKVIVVTGGARGIGESIVRKLAEEDAIPCIIDVNEPLANQVCASLIRINKKCFFAGADLTDAVQCRQAIEKIISRYQKIDGLVNNAGLNDGIGLEEGSYDRFIHSLKLNAVHYYLITELVQSFLKLSKGSIVNICSKVAETGQGDTSGYAAANGMRLEMSTVEAREVIAAGVRVNAVVVAECATPQYEWWLNTLTDPEGQLRKINAKIPLYNRRTSPDEIAETTVFLLSEKSSGINGEFFHVDGGYVHLDRSI
ncbi:SDR family oxidoreductase [Foetidibacter luteolus]|uniref:SDR family oxidoreductase n=1 Tax=Foetidibacter luteolus TaxID=2608880 RepID=UPI00129C08A8|nr:SDR family oxidoreductase [Foetidibacter luteolus]